MEDDGEDEEAEPLFFGGVTQQRRERIEETEAMRVASRINEALAMKRLPQEEPLMLAETEWYDELGVDPTATPEELRIRYLEEAADVEERLSYLLEQGGYDEDEDSDAEDVEDEEDFEEDEEEEEDERAIALQAEAEGLISRMSSEDVAEEAEEIASEFMRISNLYQILAVPQLRRIYDEGGVEGLSMRVPQLSKGLLEPERVLKMARGVKEKFAKESLLLRKEPRTESFTRYQGANSIRQVLRRMTDMFRVWCFKSKASLERRQGTIFTELPEVAVFGRVNSGKSNMIQHLFSAAKPRTNHLAGVAQTPGKTQGIDVFCVNRRFTVADMPGYSNFATQHEGALELAQDWSTKWKPLVEEYLDSTPWLRAAVYVHDIAKDVTAQDRKMLDMLRKRKIPVLLVFSKDDKVDSDTHRLSRVKKIRRELRWPAKLPHAYCTTRRGGYGQVFKNMLGTMILGLLSTEKRKDAKLVLESELPDIFLDYRDKWVPRPRGARNERLPKPKKVREYPNEDKPYTDEELEAEEEEIERREMRRVRQEQKASGVKRTLRDDIEEVAGSGALTPQERRKRWAEMLEASNT